MNTKISLLLALVLGLVSMSHAYDMDVIDTTEMGMTMTMPEMLMGDMAAPHVSTYYLEGRGTNYTAAYSNLYENARTRKVKCKQRGGTWTESKDKPKVNVFGRNWVVGQLFYCTTN